MQQIKSYQSALFLFITIAGFSLNSNAGLNPFDKSLSIKFGTEVQWTSDKSGSTKTGRNKHRGNNVYYQLIINDQQLKLRLAKSNDAGQSLESRPVETLDVLDIIVNGNRLNRFQWCLNNRLNPVNYKMLRIDTRVRDNICLINKDKGEIIIKLNEASHLQLKEATTLIVEFKLDKYVTHLTYKMQGFSTAYNQYISLNKKPSKTKLVNKSVPEKTTVKKLKKVTKTCYTRIPVEFSKTIKPVSYPCRNRTMQSAARQSTKSEILEEKRRLKAEKTAKKQQQERRLAQREKLHQEELRKKEDEITQKKEMAWKQKNTKTWVNRCKIHWNKGVSPCYCKPYLNMAPANTEDTCGK